MHYFLRKVTCNKNAAPFISRFIDLQSNKQHRDFDMSLFCIVPMLPKVIRLRIDLIMTCEG